MSELKPELKPALAQSGPNQTAPNNGAHVAVGWASGFEHPARAYADLHKLPIINELPDWRGLCLYLDERGWSLIESLRGTLDHKGAFHLRLESKYSAQGKDPLIRAMGKASSILDMTAGWGSDALHIAASGRSVLAVERASLVYLLLEQAMSKGGACAAPGELRFLNLDSAAKDFKTKLETQLQSGTEQSATAFELVYLDPMFSDKGVKSAKSKKPMAIMQQLLAAPEPENESAMFANAMQIAQKRVVVKRALKAPYLDGLVPQGSIKSKLLRFDLYTP